MEREHLEDAAPGRSVSRKHGFAAMPAIITTAVAVTLLQIPLVYKSKSETGFSGNLKAKVSARSLAEAGVEEAITDIGRKNLRVGALTDTLPYVNVGLGRGSYTTRVRAFPGEPDRVEVLSTGRVGKTSQSIRASMELIKTQATIPYDTPRFSAWGIRGVPATLYYQSLNEKLSGHAWIHPEGEVLLSGGEQLRVGGFTVGPDGTLYFINNAPGGTSTLYRIRPSELDDNPATPVTARMIGPTEFAVGGVDEIRGLAFVPQPGSARNGVLYAVTWKSKRLVELSLDHGAASPVASLAPKDLASGAPFPCEALAVDSAGDLYVLGGESGSGLWRWDGFSRASDCKTASLAHIADLPGAAGKARALAAHPDGNLYATDAAGWFRISPVSDPENRVKRIFPDASDLSGMGFLYSREDLKCNRRALPRLVSVCHVPAGRPGNAHTVLAAEDAVAAREGATDAPGRCRGEETSEPAIDTSIQLKITSWEEHSGDLAERR